MRIKIKHRWSGVVLYAAESESLREAVIKAIQSGADLYGANLTGADLTRADLTRADLTPVRDDLWSVMSGAPTEVHGLRKALIDGRIDGSTYQGECACLVGTLANACGAPFNGLPLVKPNSDRPAERWFLAIRRGDTPATNQFSKLALSWIDAWPPLKFIPQPVVV